MQKTQLQVEHWAGLGLSLRQMQAELGHQSQTQARPYPTGALFHLRGCVQTTQTPQEPLGEVINCESLTNVWELYSDAES